MKLHTIDRDEFHRTYGRLDTRRAIYGFTLQDDTNVILTLLAYQKPERILEIGTAAGHMTANFSEWSPENAVVFSLGTVIGIPAGRAEQAYENPDREHFGAQAGHFGKDHKIQLIAADSLAYDFHKLAPIDFAFIDGAHDVEHVLSDSLKIYRELAAGGCIVWHDFNSPTPWVEVGQALEQTDFPEPIQHVAGTEVAFLLKAPQPSQPSVPGNGSLQARRHFPPDGDRLAQARRCHQAGELPQAEGLYQQLLVANPQQPELWYALGEVRHRLRKLPEAAAAYENALRMQPERVGAYLALAEVYKDQGKRDEAVNAYRQALHLNPQQPDTETNLGVLLAELGRIDEAIAHWQQALHLQPDCAKAVHNLGVALAQKGKHQEALGYLERALALKPDYAEACFNLGNVLVSLNRQEEAVTRFREALQLRSDYADAYHNLGCVLTELHRPAEASVFLHQLLRLRPAFAEGHNQLGLALAAQGKYVEAEASYREALRLDAKSANAHSNLGNAYQEQGRLDEALACYDLALWFDPDSATTRWNRSLSLLQKGDFERGWKEYECRWQRKQTPPRLFAQPRWDGSPLDGRTLLIYMEQGLGDMLQFIRYAGLAKAHGGHIVVECPPFLLPLISRCRGIDQVVAEGTPFPDFDVQAPLMSLPGFCGTTLATIPAEVPYLFADERLVEHWRQWLADARGPHKRLQVGIVWQGNPHHGLDRYRSVALRAFALLAKMPGVQLLSLQKGFGSEQVRDLAGRFSIVEPPGGPEPTGQAFEDTTALMSNLDLVISVDTATAHLAGGLGVPVWVPLSAIGEWRWLLKRPDSPWYPTMRLFRQRKLGHWRLVFRRMAGELKKLRLSFFGEITRSSS
jgi:tetratricopeptide (TPR) repeat protein/predicted O-methyltransferase YrrM